MNHKPKPFVAKIIPDEVCPPELIAGEGGITNVLKEMGRVIRRKGQVKLTQEMILQNAFLIAMPCTANPGLGFTFVEEAVMRVCIMRPRANIVFTPSLVMRVLALDAMKRPRINGKPVSKLSRKALEDLSGETAETVSSDLRDATSLGLIMQNMDGTITLVHRAWINWLEEYDSVNGGRIPGQCDGVKAGH